MTSEKSIMNETLIEVTSLPETMAYRQNTGQAWQGERLRVEAGEYVKVEAEMIILRKARPVSFGVPGAGDIIGSHKGRPFQIETKTAVGPQRKNQQLFEIAWKKAGGLYFIVRERGEAARKLLTSEL